MAQPAPIGLSNPYDGRAGALDARPSRPRPALARVAVLAGVTGAAAVGLGGASSAWADTSTATPVARYDPGNASCPRLHQPVLNGSTTTARGPVAVRSVRVGARSVATGGLTGRSQAWPLRCGSPPWAKPLPVDPDPWTPEPTDPSVGDPSPSPGDPIDGSQVVSVQGTVDDGVEPGCVVLSGGDGRQWTLTGPLRMLPHGVPLAITGTVTPGLLTTCQQGEPIQVRQVALLDGADVARPAVPIVTTDRLAAEARSVPVARVAPVVEPACRPAGVGKIPSVALCTR